MINVINMVYVVYVIYVVNVVCVVNVMLEAESLSGIERRRRNTAHRKRRSKSTAQPQEAEEVPIDGWTSGLDMLIEGDSLSMKDLGIDLSIIDGYPGVRRCTDLASR